MARGFAVSAFGTPAAKKWDTVLAALKTCDAAVDLFAETEETNAKEIAILDLSMTTRKIMWNTPAPDLSSLAWKLEQAIYYEDLQDEADHPLNCVLRDLKKLGAN